MMIGPVVGVIVGTGVSVGVGVSVAVGSGVKVGAGVSVAGGGGRAVSAGFSAGAPPLQAVRSKIKNRLKYRKRFMFISFVLMVLK